MSIFKKIKEFISPQEKMNQDVIDVLDKIHFFDVLFLIDFFLFVPAIPFHSYFSNLHQMSHKNIILILAENVLICQKLGILNGPTQARTHFFEEIVNSRFCLPEKIFFCQ